MSGEREWSTVERWDGARQWFKGGNPSIFLAFLCCLLLGSQGNSLEVCDAESTLQSPWTNFDYQSSTARLTCYPNLPPQNQTFCSNLDLYMVVPSPIILCNINQAHWLLRYRHVVIIFFPPGSPTCPSCSRVILLLPLSVQQEVLIFSQSEQ